MIDPVTGIIAITALGFGWKLHNRYLLEDKVYYDGLIHKPSDRIFISMDLDTNRVIISGRTQALELLCKKIEWAAEKHKERVIVKLNDILGPNSTLSSLAVISPAEWRRVFTGTDNRKPKIFIDTREGYFNSRKIVYETRIWLESNEAQMAVKDIRKLSHQSGPMVFDTQYNKNNGINLLKIIPKKELVTSVKNNTRPRVSASAGKLTPLNIKTEKQRLTITISGSVNSFGRIRYKLMKAAGSAGKKRQINTDSLFELSGQSAPIIEILDDELWEEMFPKVDGVYDKFFIKNYKNTMSKPLTIIIHEETAMKLAGSMNRLGISTEIILRGYPYYEEFEKSQGMIILKMDDA